MTIAPGSRLGPYEILSPLGAGGMGEVWRAKDARLGREVAVKVLPEDVSSDHDRVKRFELEARAASALNHPNIVTIHEIGEEQGRAYLVMERVEGQTLGEILHEGPLPMRRRAFEKNTPVETLSAIIREAPEPVGPQNSRAPAPLRWTIERCLAKNPEDRYVSTRDLARDLASVRDHLSEATITGEPIASPS